MEASEIATALDLYKTAHGWLNGYWTLFSGAALALVGLVFGGKTTLSTRSKAAISIAFGLFAVSNNLAMRYVLEIRTTADSVISRSIASGESSPEFVALLSQLDAPPGWRVQVFQALLTVIVLGAMWMHSGNKEPVAADGGHKIT